MYRFIDRPIAGLAPGEQMLVWSMRAWVGAMAAQRCPCATLGPAFSRWRVPELLPDFNMTMFVLNGDGLRRMRFGAGCAQVHDDEATLLVLFHAAAGGDDRRVRRLAAQLVNGEALNAFIVAARQSADVLRRVATPRTPD